MRTLWILLGSLGGLAGTYLLHLGEGYRFPWLLIAVATLASLFGLAWGLLGAAAAWGLEGLLPGGHPGYAAPVLLAAVLLADFGGKELRRAYQRQRETAAQLTLLVAALEELSGLTSQEAILRALPGLLGRYDQGHVAVWQPQPGGLRLVWVEGLDDQPPLWVPDSGVMGRCVREGRAVYVPDVRQDSTYIAAPQRGLRSELALPLKERGQVVAVLNLERSRPFGRHELEGLERFARAVSLQLSQLSERAELQFLNQLSASLDSASTPSGVAERALALLAQALGVDQGRLWMQQGSRMVAVAGFGGVDEAEEIPYGQGLVWQVYATGRPIYAQNYGDVPQALPRFREAIGGVVVHPVLLPNQERPRLVLSLYQGSPRRWRESEQDLLAAACRTLGLALEGVLAAQQRDVLISLAREAVEIPAEAVYERLLRAAVHMVPGAEAGSLVVREGSRFCYKALLGYEEGLRGQSFSEAEELRWYAGAADDWRRGEPRILSRLSTDFTRLKGEALGAAGRVEEIAANLALPVAHRGEVLAVLYLDNLHDPAAFGEDSLYAARFFAAPIAALLHGVRYRELLEQAATTDPLTGLANRRAFDQRLEEEFGRAERYGQPLSLLVMDLSGFKQVNDRLGHAKGDEALVEVARVLRANQRDGDTLFRWGGDEFAALLPHTELSGAVKAAQRYAESIRRICLEGLALGVNIGVATYPGDADDPEALLREADERMYRAKRCGVSVLEA
ncbi:MULTISPECIES: diguanylate cyclase [unclassified Meiothermus]|uniref:diguanylate cyclase n=1 Tax=unclassified Meiothermus TaxID=370471 RepID=UPI000D7C82AF|nr:MULTISPECIES: diguanylate cyclase [unclassified Meiothermus]PZA08465.1 diguanylate cyclase [Meiothermus sp. Pnk-1]RYM36549.1 diguanylate cyclase [Meiothermus sp. PNK-Is4]